MSKESTRDRYTHTLTQVYLPHLLLDACDRRVFSAAMSRNARYVLHGRHTQQTVPLCGAFTNPLKPQEDYDDVGTLRDRSIALRPQRIHSLRGYRSRIIHIALSYEYTTIEAQQRRHLSIEADEVCFAIIVLARFHHTTVRRRR